MISKEVLEQARRLEIYTRRKVNENFAGQYESAFRGRGMEFAEIRQYLPGDDIRTIDWNVTARTGEPFVKTFVEERELSVLLAVDGSSSALFGSGSKSKKEVAAELCAVLALTAVRQQDKVGLMIFTEQVEHFVPPSKSRRHCLKLITDLLQFEPGHHGTSISTAVDTAARVLKKRSIVFLVSDFLSPGYEHSLKLIKQRHDLIAVTVSDPREHELPNVGLIELYDWENGQALLVDSSSRAVRTAYAKAAKVRSRQLQQSMRRLGVDQIPVTTDKPFLPSLIRFFQGRGGKR
jgi:uncharacterized protein (DUF58 family)